jgi:CheY-like chemotaxis protein
MNNEQSTPHKDTIKVLITDDEPLMRSVTVEILRLSGYETYSAENGIQALAILKSQPVDLIITDVMMPEMNGLELLRHVRQEISATMPVIIVSGSLLQAAKSLESAFTIAMEKPYDYNVLLENIHQMVTRHRQLLIHEMQFGTNAAFA